MLSVSVSEQEISPSLSPLVIVAAKAASRSSRAFFLSAFAVFSISGYHI
jgi:hypothetical protein